jgi:hypothetical protein
VQNLRSATTLSTRGANGADLCITEVHKACYLDPWEQGQLYALLHDVKFSPWCNEIFAFVVCYTVLTGSYVSGHPVGPNLDSSGPLKADPVGCPETSVTANKRRVTSQKKEDRIYLLLLILSCFLPRPDKIL